MTNDRNLLIVSWLSFLLVPVAYAELVPFDSERWMVKAEDHKIVTFEGRQALQLTNGEAWIRDLEITDGEIGFDIAFDSERGFSGAIWRMTDPNNFEEFYLRHHQSGNPDANQYTPIFNGNAAWQLYHGEGYATPVSYRFNEWMHVKIRYSGSRAEVFIDSENPVLKIPDLKHKVRAGRVGVSSTYAPAYFSNFSIEPLKSGLASDPVTAEKEAPSSGIIAEWLVSEAFPGAELDDTVELDSSSLRNRRWQRLEAEANGITNLAQVARLSGNHDTVFAKAVVESQVAQVTQLRFGYSDNVRLYVNCRLIYAGSNTYRSRDYRYLGTIGLFDSIFLDLQPGTNEILFAVQENFGGWGVMAQLVDSTAVGQVMNTHEERQKLATELDSVVSRRASDDGFHGSVLVSRGGEILLHKTYGPLADSPGQQEPAFWIASNSKQFTGAAVAILAGEGKLDVEARIGNYLKDVPLDKQPITLRQLLTHTSGLGQLYAAEGINDRDEAARAILEPPLIGIPGATYSYSSDGFSLLAIVVEIAAGEPFEEFMQTRLLDPAGMSATGFWGFEKDGAIAPPRDPQAALGQKDTIYADGHSRPNWGYRGATGLYSTTRDLHAWITRLLKLGSERDNPLARVLSPAQYVREAEGIGSVYYGFGIAVVLRDGVLDMISHNGDDDWLGHSSTVSAYADGDTIIVLSNAGYLTDGTSWSAEISRDIRGLLRN